MELIKELGRRIQKARKEKGLTQQELADLSHVSLKHVQGCERGVKNPSFEVLRAFCKVLNLSLDSLMNLDLPEDEQAANDMRQLYRILSVYKNYPIQLSFIIFRRQPID
ncbi:helix-turn-helix domain-containing protein [Gemmiger formicilis]|uniref:helix-turn-helix domain-containing protein n=1 Tax=Gemmiger formicilis TaxID=745368 RepID=UPI003991B945